MQIVQDKQAKHFIAMWLCFTTQWPTSRFVAEPLQCFLFSIHELGANGVALSFPRSVVQSGPMVLRSYDLGMAGSGG